MSLSLKLSLLFSVLTCCHILRNRPAVEAAYVLSTAPDKAVVIVPRYRFPSILLCVLRSHLIYRTIYLTNLTNIIVFILIISAFYFAFLFFYFFFYFLYQSLLIFALNIWVFLSTLIGYYLYRLSNLVLFPSFLHSFLPSLLPS